LHAVVAVDTLVNLSRGVDGEVILVADASHRLDVVGVVVGNEHMMNRTKAKTKVPELLL
jgi:hypothetical protein